MGDNLYLLAFGTFGNPYGFRQNFVKAGNESLARAFKQFDLNTNAIKVFPDSTLYALKKEVVDGLLAVAYSKYTFAKEPNSDRGGTFIGSSVLFTTEIAEEKQILANLDEFHQKLIERNVVNNVISVNHSNQFNVIIPRDFDKLAFGTKKIDIQNPAPTGKTLVVYCDTSLEKIEKRFKETLVLLNKYDCIFFTSSEEVARFVHQKAIFKLANGEAEVSAEIKLLDEEQKRFVQNLINDFESEAKKIDCDKKGHLAEIAAQIERNVKLHHENSTKIAQSREQKNLIERHYTDYKAKLNEAIQQLKANRRPEEVRALYLESKKQFTERLALDHQTVRLTEISNRSFGSAPHRNLDPIAAWDQTSEHRHSYSRRKKTRHNDVYKLIAISLALLWVSTLAYFLT